MGLWQAVSQKAISFTVNVNIKEGKMAVSFHPHTEPNVLMDTGSGGQRSRSACLDHVARQCT